MSYTTDFVNNKLYGADDINSIRTVIMTEGIIKKGEADCLVTLMADGIRIGAGEALFNDGCRIASDQEQILAHDGSDCYVYFDRRYYDVPKADAGKTLPENCIPLAKIEGGAVTDLRDFATLKIPTMAANRYLAKELELDFSAGPPTKTTMELTFEDRTDVNYVMFTHQYGKYQTKVLIDFAGDRAFGFCGNGIVNDYNNFIGLYAIGLHIAASKTGNRVIFNIENTYGINLGNATVMAM